MGTQVRIRITEAAKADAYDLIFWHGATKETAPAAVVMVALAHAVRMIASEHDPDLAAEYAVALGACVQDLIDGVSAAQEQASVSIDLDELESTFTILTAPGKDPRGSLLWQAATLASGTLATLTGFNRYADLDAVRFDFMDFCEENEGRFDSWRPAWQAFATLKGFTRGTAE